MKIASQVKRGPPPRIVPEPSEQDIREYAYHLYEKSGRVPGRDLENWLQAKACLQRARGSRRSRTHARRAIRGAGPLEQEELCAFSAESHNLSH